MLRFHASIWLVTGLASISTNLSLLGASPAAAQTIDEGLMDCPLCVNPTHEPQDPFALFTSGPNTFSCQSAFELGVLRLPPQNCSFWQSRGSVVCRCADEPPPRNECTLCEDKGPLPAPLKAGTPERACAELQVDARRDSPDQCVTYQQTYGVYCGCENPQVTSQSYDVCRLCGSKASLGSGSDDENSRLKLPNTVVSLFVDFNETAETSCAEAEFAANLPGANCEDFQLLYSDFCCLVDAANESEEISRAQSALSFHTRSLSWFGVLATVLASFL